MYYVITTSKFTSAWKSHSALIQIPTLHLISTTSYSCLFKTDQGLYSLMNMLTGGKLLERRSKKLDRGMEVAITLIHPLQFQKWNVLLSKSDLNEQKNRFSMRTSWYKIKWLYIAAIALFNCGRIMYILCSAISQGFIGHSSSMSLLRLCCQRQQPQLASLTEQDLFFLFHRNGNFRQEYHLSNETVLFLLAQSGNKNDTTHPQDKLQLSDLMRRP